MVRNSLKSPETPLGFGSALGVSCSLHTGWRVSSLPQVVAPAIEKKRVALGIEHAAPVGQPQRVHQLTDPILPAYTVAGDEIRLAGCMLEDVPVLRCGKVGGQGARERICSHRASEYCPVSLWFVRSGRRFGADCPLRN